ncbi:MAG: hypothetical protein NVV74_04295 [Magnetospirillum sp.]|nr:hypothetical protein [Magnetospirillum sp.]
MARPMAMGPQAPHQYRPAHPAAPSPQPQAHPARRPSLHPAHQAGHGGLIALALIVLAAMAAACWIWLGGAAPKVDPGAQLQAQMEAAARGVIAPTHAFGGSLTVMRDNGRTNVTAEKVPSRACVQVGWRLAKEGTIIVNGVLAPRLSAAKLSELCSGEDATLLWVPDE